MTTIPIFRLLRLNFEAVPTTLGRGHLGVRALILESRSVQLGIF